MSNELMIQEKPELTPAVWAMINGIVQSSIMSKPEQFIVTKKMLFAYESGLSLSTAVNGGLYCVKDRIEAEGTVIRSKIDQLPNYHLKIDRSDNEAAVLSLWRKAEADWPFALYGDGKGKVGDWVKLGEVSFTEEDAKRADLLSKDTYKKYPADLYLNRATSRLYKRLIPWLFASPIYIHGEIEGTDFNGDFIEGKIVENQPQTTLNDLVNRFKPDDILTANNGRMPSTQAEINAVWAKLSETNASD